MKITPAKLTWDENNVPYSLDFKDRYFNAEDGLAETEHVFIRGSHLRKRWKSLPEKSAFCIAETGFGSGLNLLASLRLWQEVAPKSAQLHYVSIEQYPMSREDLKRAHAHWPELAHYSNLLIHAYPSLLPGYHRFTLARNVTVTLIFSNASDALSSLCPPLYPELENHQPYAIDAWFLDGFTPSLNPAMWQESLFPFLTRLSKTNTTIATFTAATEVRKNIERHGFSVTKIKGFGGKREMITAVLHSHKNQEASSAITTPTTKDLTPFQPRQKQPKETRKKKPSRCWTLTQPPIKKSNSTVGIIGAGIAGATLARALANRGLTVDVYEAHSAPAAEASGIPQVALYGKLSPDSGDLEDFVLQAMPYAQKYYRALFSDYPNAELGKLCGLVQFSKNKEDLLRMTRIAERLNQGNDFVTLHDALDHKNIYIHYNTPISTLKNINGQWQLSTQHNQLKSYERLILCTANATKTFAELDWLPTKPIRGQVSLIPSNTALKPLKTVLCREIQLSPASHGYHCTGASYGLNDASLDIKNEDQEANLSKLTQMLSDCLSANQQEDSETNTTQSSAGKPVTTITPAPLPHPAPVQEGLFINLGHGSRGYSYAPLCAEVLASQICAEPPPLPDYLRESINPARFLVRGLIRNQY